MFSFFFSRISAGIAIRSSQCRKFKEKFSSEISTIDPLICGAIERVGPNAHAIWLVDLKVFLLIFFSRRVDFIFYRCGKLTSIRLDGWELGRECHVCRRGCSSMRVLVVCQTQLLKRNWADVFMAPKWCGLYSRIQYHDTVGPLLNTWLWQSLSQLLGSDCWCSCF